MTTPPPPDPYPAAPAPTPPPEGEHRPGPRRWRWVVAGATAGAVLTVAAAIPVTWAIRNTVPVVTGEQQLRTGIDDERNVDGGIWSQPAALVPSHTSDGDASEEQETGVVLIDTVLSGGEAAGTGLVLSEDGLVLTNYHVVDGSSELTATVAATGDTYTGQVVGYDEEADIALVQLDDASGLDQVRLDGDGDDDEVGDEVTAVGNARGQGSLSAVTGTVTAVDQRITTSPPDAESLDGLIETNAAAVPGYSGGPTLDDEGEVIGVTTAASSTGAAESYAVPIEDALAVAQAIEDGDESDTVHIGPPAYLGVAVSDEAGNGDGVPVADVPVGTPAAEAGLVAGDRITAIDGETVSSADELVAALGQHEPGDRVDIVWTTNGAERRATVTLAESPYA